MIKKIETLEDLQPDPHNANRGTPRGHGIIEQSVRQRGAGRSGLAAADGTMIAGSQTLQKMAELGIPIRPIHTTGEEWVVVIRDDIEPGSEEAQLLAIEDNRSSQLGLDWEPAVLAGIAESGVDLSGLFTDVEWAEVSMPALPEAGAGGDEFDPTPEDGPTRTNVGELWSIGGVHRLLVGDCTDAANVARLMVGERAKLFATDPPYGVALRLEDNHEASNAAKGTDKTYRHFVPIDGDDLEGSALQVFLESAFVAWLPHLDEHAAWYLWHAQMTQGFFAAAAAAADILIHRQIIWAKPHFIFGRGDYHWQHELCFYGWRRGSRPPFYGQRNQSTVWNLDEGGGAIRKDQGHPTQKPIKLFTIPMENHCKPGDIAAEPFAGSGSQLIAGHRAGVRVYMCEIAPRYADVILRRAEAEGLEVTLMDG